MRVHTHSEDLTTISGLCGDWKSRGNEVGLKTGFELGEEKGFLRGCVDIRNAALQKHSVAFPP
uniref:Essential protein Yae1 N-terminal domain-containing protein n=1 Tax=Physcomitrium patens TaxID=3218 RepID=A0A7I4B6V5_PHYPA